MKKKISLIIMSIILTLCIVGYLSIKDIAWEDTANPNAASPENTQTIGDAIESMEE